MTDLIIAFIPAYNEEDFIGSVIKGVKNYFDRVVVVDDGSTDDTRQEAARAGATVLRHDKNLGKGASLKTGFDFILNNFPRTEAVITLDADGQHESGEIPEFINVFRKTAADLIIGERVINRWEMPFLRQIGNSAVSWLISRKIGQKIYDTQSGFRLFSGKFLENFKPESSGYGVETEIILAAAKNKFKIAAIPVSTVYRNKNSVNFLKDARIISSIISELICG